METLKISNSSTFEQKENTQGKLVLEGYLAHFKTPNINGETYEPSAFDDFLEYHKQTTSVLPLVLMHNDTDISATVGFFNLLEKREDGLWGRATLVETDFIKNEVIPRIKAGVWPNFSIGGKAFDFVKENNLSRINGCFLTHVALVSQGADWQADVEQKIIANKAKLLAKNKTTFKGLKL